MDLISGHGHLVAMATYQTCGGRDRRLARSHAADWKENARVNWGSPGDLDLDLDLDLDELDSWGSWGVPGHAWVEPNPRLLLRTAGDLCSQRSKGRKVRCM